MNYALENGITLFDTAAAYSGGISEKIIGEWLVAKGDEAKHIVIATKILPPFDKNSLSVSVDQSIGRLKRKYIDILFLHSWHASLEDLRVLEELNALLASGRVGALGASNFNSAQLKAILEKVLLLKETAQEGSFHLFEMGEGGNGASVIVEQNTKMPEARQGFGTIHHAAFRVADANELNEWIAWLNKLRLPNSGLVDRFFFKSLYARVAPQILFEFATDGPGFMGDEPYETLGEKLSLPPFLEPQRAAIEKSVRPIDTIRSNKSFTKE